MYYSTYNYAYLIDSALNFYRFYLLFIANLNLINQIILNITTRKYKWIYNASQEFY